MLDYFVAHSQAVLLRVGFNAHLGNPVESVESTIHQVGILWDLTPTKAIL